MISDNIVISRLSASTIALILTWTLNRKYTFSKKFDSQFLETVTYILIGYLAAIVNLFTTSIFFEIEIDKILLHLPSYLLGAIAGMFFSFSMNLVITFKMRD